MHFSLYCSAGPCIVSIPWAANKTKSINAGHPRNGCRCKTSQGLTCSLPPHIQSPSISKMKLIAVITGALGPTLTLALVGNHWVFDKIPDGGLDDITFLMDMHNAPHEYGFFFAQQFDFMNAQSP